MIQSFGLTGAIKGLNVLAPDGTPVRPDMVILDDCQTRESAKSPTQTDDRERIICDDVMGLAGPRTNIAAVFLCTPIYPNDLTERFINRDRHPEWQGTRTRMVELDGRTVGWIRVEPRSDHDWLDLVVVDPAHQGLGLGTRVMLALLAEARARGVALHLSVYRENRARALYRRLERYKL